MSERLSGILLHITSLPGKWGLGDFSPEAFHFIDWLEESGQSLWQILPLTIPDSIGSPYAALSACAMNPGFIDPEMLCRNGLLSKKELAYYKRRRRGGQGKNLRKDAVSAAYRNWLAERDKKEFDAFCAEKSYWLHDAALFMSIHQNYPGGRLSFPQELSFREPDAIREWEIRHADTIHRFKFEQYILSKHWHEIKSYANDKGIRIIGDIPIFISGDSADVWAHPELFKLDNHGYPTVWTGVPPDYFTKTGQLWAQPHYNWEAIKENKYKWWIERVRTVKTHADIIRMDHFRGFCAAYEIPARSVTAEKGKWVEGPRERIFKELHENIPDLCIIAEDLGIITPDVDDLRRRLGYPGMKVLQFAFSGDEANTYLPENYDRNDRFVVYTGTHDNNTTRAWYETLSGPEKEMLARYTSCGKQDISNALTEMAFYSDAMWAVIPMQDILNLGEEARMNCPGTLTNNWKWQLDHLDISSEITDKLRILTLESGRKRENGK